ncbi:growth-regulating factor 6-like [Lycium barbarum]|uniref:growth-regulating factor 6-like n=1 Tax=Lycium barbarum TaxID=112863 RepID=UPI00293F4E04|nr:growth-regulating factor 6-like [Lycium barbarum]
MMNAARSGYPFTATQWQELEHQALIYKYMVSGMPVPPDLLYTIRRSLDSSSLSSKFILQQPQHVGWNCIQLGFGKKMDPEPGRCRRTDGKKWRCSKEAYADSKYCERHMHRGRNRSRKPVEVMTTSTTRTTTTNTPPTAIPISSIKKNSNYSPTSLSCLTSSEPHYPHSSSIGFSSHDHTKFLFDSCPYSRNSYGHGMKEEADKHVFYSDSSGTLRNSSGSSSILDDSWQLTMGSPLGHLKQRTYSVSQQLQSLNESQERQDQYHYNYALGNDVKSTDMPVRIDTEEPKKVMHHFFDELPPQDNKHSWLHSGDGPLSKTHLSISVPNSSPDFFITHNGK